MEVTFERSSTFKKIIESIRELCKEVTFNFDEETGLTIQAMDSSHVSLISLHLKESLKTFTCQRPSSIGVNIEWLSKILKVCDNEGNLNMCLQRGDEIDINFTSSEKSLSFEMKLLDLDMEQLEIPDMKYSVDLVLPSSEFSKVVKDLLQFGDTITLTVNEGTVKFEVSGDFSRGAVTYSQGNKILIQGSTTIECSYALKYLSYFSKACTLCDNVILRLSEGVPLEVRFEISQNDYLAYYLAPKIDT